MNNMESPFGFAANGDDTKEASDDTGLKLYRRSEEIKTKQSNNWTFEGLTTPSLLPHLQVVTRSDQVRDFDLRSKVGTDEAAAGGAAADSIVVVQKILDFATTAGSGVVRDSFYGTAAGMEPKARLDLYKEAMQVPFSERRHHDIVDLLVAHYDKAKTDAERKVALQLLGEQIQAGNNSAAPAKVGLSAHHAATRIIQAQRTLDNSSSSTAQKQSAETQRAEALRDLVALATLTDPHSGEKARELIADLRRGPLKGLAREAIEKAEQEVQDAARKRNQYLVEKTIRSLNSPADQAQGILNTIESVSKEQALAESHGRSVPIVDLARASVAIRQLELNINNPANAIKHLGQLLDNNNPAVREFIAALQKSDVGKNLITLLKSGDTTAAAELLRDSSLRRTLAAEVVKARTNIQEYGKINANALARVLEYPKLLQQAKKEARELDEIMRRKADQLIEQFLRRGHHSDDIFKELIDGMRPNKDGSLDANKLSQSLLGKLTNGLGGFAPEVQPLIAKLVNGARQLSKEDVEALQKAYGQSGIAHRDKTLEELNNLSSNRLGRFGGDIENAIHNLRAINTVGDIHRKLALAMEALNAQDTSARDRQKALDDVKAAFERFVKDGPQSELARQYLRPFNDKDVKRLLDGLSDKPDNAMSALAELRTKLPDGHADLNEFRAARTVRNLSEKSTSAEFAAASRALEAEIGAERMAGRPENRVAKEWLKWTQANGAVTEINEALAANDKDKALRAIKSLEGMTPANEHARLRLYMVLQGLTTPGKHLAWTAQAEKVSSKPVYGLAGIELAPSVRKELTRAAFNAIDSKIDTGKIDSLGAHAITSAYAQLDGQERSAIQRILNVAVNKSNGQEVLKGILLGIADNGTGTRDLVPLFLKGNRFDSFPARINDVHKLASSGNPAAMLILSSLACGVADKNDSNYSETAATALRELVETPAHRKTALTALLDALDKRAKNSDYTNSHLTLELVGKTASLLTSEGNVPESKKLIERTLKSLRDEFKESSSDKNSQRYKQTVAGYLTMARHLEKQDIKDLSNDLSPAVIEQIRRHGSQLSRENQRELAGNLAHMAAHGKHFSHGGVIRDDVRLAAFEALAEVNGGLNSEQLQKVVDAAKGSLQENYAGLITVRALATNQNAEVKALAAKILTQGLKTWKLDKDDRQALVDIFRDGKPLQPEVIRKVAKVYSQLEIPAPAELLLTNLGIPLDTELPKLAERIRQKYKHTPEGGDELLRRGLANAEAVNMLTGKERAQIMGWEKLSDSQKKGLGWFENPPDSVLARLGLDKLPTEQRQNIEQQVQSALRAGKQWNAELSADVKEQLHRLGQEEWQSLSNDRKESIRWSEAQKINVLQLVGQMANGIAGDTPNAGLLTKNLGIDISRLHEQKSLASFAADQELERLNDQRRQKLAELLKITQEGPEKSLIADAFRASCGYIFGGGKALWNGEPVAKGIFEGYATVSMPATDRLKHSFANNGRDKELVAKQINLLEEIETLTKDIAKQQIKRVQLTDDERRIHLAAGAAQHKRFLDSGRLKDADDEAIRLWKSHGPQIMSRPEIWETLNGRSDEMGALARLKQQGLCAWDKVPNYSIDAAGKPLGQGKADQIEIWKGALGLKPIFIEPSEGGKHDNNTGSEARGLVQLSPKFFPDRQIRDALVQHAFKSLDSDPVIRKFQNISGELEGPLSKMSRMFQVGMGGTPYEDFVKEAQKLAGQVQTAMERVSREDLKDLRARVIEMEKALLEMKKQGRNRDPHDSAYAELEKRVENFKRLHDMLNPGTERLKWEPIKDEKGQYKRDPNTNAIMCKDQNKEIQNILKGINEGGLKPATFTNWAKENGPLIGATLVAMAATAAACGTFGTMSPAAAAAWMAVGTLAAKEFTREGLYHLLNKDGYSGYGKYGDHGSDIGNWYRFSDQRGLESNLEKLTGVAGQYLWEVTKDFVGNVLGGAAGGKILGKMPFEQALLAQIRQAPNALHLAFKAERTLLQLEGNALAKSYLKEFLTHFGENLATNVGFAAVHTGVETSLRGSTAHKFCEKWLGHEVLNWGLSTSLAIGQGFLRSARMKGQDFHYQLKDGMSRTDFIRFMQKEGFLVTQSKTNPAVWEAVPIAGGKNAKPVRLIEEGDALKEKPNTPKPKPEPNQISDAKPRDKTSDKSPEKQSSRKEPSEEPRSKPGDKVSDNLLEPLERKIQETKTEAKNFLEGPTAKRRLAELKEIATCEVLLRALEASNDKTLSEALNSMKSTNTVVKELLDNKINDQQLRSSVQKRIQQYEACTKELFDTAPFSDFVKQTAPANALLKKLREIPAEKQKLEDSQKFLKDKNLEDLLPRLRAETESQSTDLLERIGNLFGAELNKAYSKIYDVYFGNTPQPVKDALAPYLEPLLKSGWKQRTLAPDAPAFAGKPIEAANPIHRKELGDKPSGMTGKTYFSDEVKIGDETFGRRYEIANKDGEIKGYLNRKGADKKSGSEIHFLHSCTNGEVHDVKFKSQGNMKRSDGTSNIEHAPMSDHGLKAVVEQTYPPDSCKTDGKPAKISQEAFKRGVCEFYGVETVDPSTKVPKSNEQLLTELKAARDQKLNHIGLKSWEALKQWLNSHQYSK